MSVRASSRIHSYRERAQNTEPVFDQDRLEGDRSSTTGSTAMRSTNTEKSQVHLSTELGPPGGLEPPEPKIRQLAGSKWQVGRLDFQSFTRGDSRPPKPYCNRPTGNSQSSPPTGCSGCEIELQVTADTPLAYLAPALDDAPVPQENSKALYPVLQAKGDPV